MWNSEILITLAYYIALVLVPFVFYILLLSENRDKNSRFKSPDWYYIFKRFFSLPTLNKVKNKCRTSQLATSPEQQEQPRDLKSGKQSDTQMIHGIDENGNSIFVKMILRQNRLAEAILYLRLSTGDIYTLPSDPEVLFCSVPSRKWKTQGLSITIVEPLHRIRLLYNGFLRNLKNGNAEHVKFNFVWNTADKPIYHPQDIPNSILADALAKEPWRDGNWIDLMGDERGYEQYGALQGFITGDSFAERYELYFPCFRKHYWGTGEAFALYRDFSIFLVAKDGTLFNVGCKSFRKGCSQMKYGTLVDNIGRIHAVDQNDIRLESIGEHSIPDIITIHLKGNNKTYKCILHINHETLTTTQSNAFYGWELKMVSAECILNSQHARAIVSFWYSKRGTGVSLPNTLLSEPKTDKTCKDFLAPFSRTECKIVALAGGKGSSLALLSSLNSKNFTVPDGFVILTNAFKHQLRTNPKLQEAVDELERISRNLIEKDLSRSCQDVENLFKAEPVCKELSDIILDKLGELCKTHGKNVKWAVRSSGLNEDSEDVSAAGQNATFLGCSTKEDVIKSVAACWGSLFTFQSVQYRRQLGLDINCSMAVVIQCMIPADAAGVLFTCHPTTCDPSKIIITSNYGLGESVVSGQADPDTVTIKRTWNGNLSIKSQHIGTKKIKIEMSSNTNLNNNTTETCEIGEEKSKTLSLTEEQILILGQVGLELEKAYGSPRDIEWAFHNNKLYLLQSRPITTLNNWTEYELLHEFDLPIVTSQEVVTISNIGEVMPGALTPLSNTLINDIISKRMYKYIMELTDEPFVMKFSGVLNHHTVINVANCFLCKVEQNITANTKALDLAIFGHPVIDEQMHGVALSRFGALSKYQHYKYMFQSMKEAFFCDQSVRNAVKLAYNFTLHVPENASALDRFNVIFKNVEHIRKIIDYHTRATRTSVFYQFVAFNILLEGSDDLSVDHCYDISILLSSCSNVVSAEVPQTLQKIANLIIKSDVRDKFLKINPNDGINWLRINCPQAAQELDWFLDRHGHRGLREFELKENSWGTNHGLVISMLQLNCKGNEITRKNEYLSVEDTVAKLITPKNNTIRKILRFLVSKSRHAVVNREATKSETIRVINKTRIAFHDLAESMVSEGIIPDAQLIYYFSIYELNQVLQKKDPVLIRKALQRQRLFPKWDKLHLPELIVGFPRLEEDSSLKQFNREIGSQVFLKGTPACCGDVIARACVITDLQDVNQLQSGDVLITHATDVGWSPYFPMLSAVVTELGGLISHGAVVAREYGLPCLVGVQNATSVFKTGDKVHVSGKSGMLELVLSNENNN